VKQAGISSVFLWRRPPTGNATLCNIGASVFQGDALCPSRTSCESISSSACAWQQPVCNWWATFIALLCSGISFGWRGYGPRKRNGARARRPRQTGDFTQRTRSLCDSRPAQLSNARCDVRTRDNSRLEGVEPAFVLMSIAAADMSLLPHGLPAIPSPICIALNRSRGRRQEGVEPLLYDGVALAGCFFEAETIQNLNVPTMIADKAGLL
jgi:hypothetical protein